jgi:uncharacterized protein YfiM (DUF2279 family)
MLRLVLLLGLYGPGDHHGVDSWFGVDKVKHFFMGAFVQSVGYSAVRATGASHSASLAAATAVTAGVSIGKEVWDAHSGGTPSVRDLTWDAAGAGAATLLLRRSVH